MRRVGAAAFWRAPRSRLLGLASVRFLKHAGGYRAPLSGGKERLFLVYEEVFSYGVSKEPRFSVPRIAAAGPRQLAPSARPVSLQNVAQCFWARCWANLQFDRNACLERLFAQTCIFELNVSPIAPACSPNRLMVARGRKTTLFLPPAAILPLRLLQFLFSAPYSYLLSAYPVLGATFFLDCRYWLPRRKYRL